MYINVLEMLEEAARKYPSKTALRDCTHEITYCELQHQAKAVGTYIHTSINQMRKPIVVSIDRNIESIILFLGVIYSGNFYVPLDTGMPKERIQMILDTLEPVMILSSLEAENTLEGAVLYKEIKDTQLDEAAILMIRKKQIDTDPLYAIFTSGSTGRPKGVLISHKSVIDLVEQFEIAFPFPKEPIFGNQAPFDFDVSVKDIYNTLHLGATLVVIPKLFEKKLIAFLNEEKINTIIWAVSAMRIVENFKTFTKEIPTTLQLVMFSGEIMPVRVLQYWKDVMRDTTFVNLYGPTEITCNCSYYIVDREFEPDQSIPIGRAFLNTQILLIDPKSGNLVEEPKKQGEICVRGTCLALGYYHDKQRTKEAFVQNPFTDSYEEKIYKTGDLGYYDDKGELNFVSRKDYQIKHMGHRIELGEIEVAVNAISYLDAAVCVFDEIKEKIVLFYQPGKEAKSMFETSKELERDIVKHLALKLPKFMWPNRYVSYDTLPLNKNGKIDRVLLKSTLKE